MLDRVQATLEFPEPGKTAGSGSCNRFFGAVEIAERKISFSSLGSSRMACAEAVGIQEGKYPRRSKRLSGSWSMGLRS